MANKELNKEAKEKFNKRYVFYNNFFVSLFHNAVKIEGGENPPPKRYLLQQLLARGGIAFDYQTQLYLPYNGALIDVYGLPKKYNLFGYNGYNIWRDTNEVCILRANDNALPFADYFKNQAMKIANFDMKIEQNLEASSTTTLIAVEDESQILSLQNAFDSKRRGSVGIFLKKNLLNNFEVVDTKAEYFVDKLLEDRQKIINSTLTVLGIGSANTDKRERVQSTEIEASNFLAEDMLKILVDTFNYDAEQGKISIRLIKNTTLSQFNKELQMEDLENADLSE